MIKGCLLSSIIVVKRFQAENWEHDMPPPLPPGRPSTARRRADATLQ